MSIILLDGHRAVDRGAKWWYLDSRKSDPRCGHDASRDTSRLKLRAATRICRRRAHTGRDTDAIGAEDNPAVPWNSGRHLRYSREQMSSRGSESSTVPAKIGHLQC